MITKIENSQKLGKKNSGFGIEILFPGTAIGSKDTGIYTIGRIDHATVHPKTLVPMHPHQNDEILTYLRAGNVEHKDSEGSIEIISNKRLMMMNAGSLFYHEELVLPKSETLQGLQIFIRPEKSGLKPQVQFHDFIEVYSLNQWRKVAGKDDEYPLKIRSNTWIQDMRIEKGEIKKLPQTIESNNICLLYVFDGSILLNNKIELTKGESILIENEDIDFEALNNSDLVLFITDKNAEFSDKGMFSGNMNR